MKKIIMMTLMLVCGMTTMMAQKPAQIKFDKTTHNFGTFSENEPKVTCSFTFTNIGEQPLMINQAIASCGCTVPEYTKTESDKTTVKYHTAKQIIQGSHGIYFYKLLKFLEICNYFGYFCDEKDYFGTYQETYCSINSGKYDIILIYPIGAAYFPGQKQCDSKAYHEKKAV